MGKEKFEFTYSAPTKEERAEIEDIRKEYLEKTATEKKLDELKALDKKVKILPRVLAYVFGTIAILVFGLGLTMVLEWGICVWGVAVGALGCIFMALNYFVYKKIKTAIQKKYKSRILTLSDELLNEGQDDK